MKSLLLFLTIFIFVNVCAHNDTLHFIKVHFQYGSKPLKKYKNIEHKYFGGFHGGHVSVQVDTFNYGFTAEGKFHVFADKKNRHSGFRKNGITSDMRYYKGSKLTTFIIPITNEQYEHLNQIHTSYCSSTPYDYAFIGMRCAAATQDILSQIGVVKKRKNAKNILTTFYPKKLRKRMFKLAKKNNYKIIFQEGRATRKWEQD